MGFEGLSQVCGVLPKPGMRRGGNSRSGSGRDPGLAGKQNPAVPAPSLEKASLIPGFWQEIPNPSQSQECV